mgnify:CR=1 FL=1
MEELGLEHSYDFDPSVEEWMKDHTIGDLRNLASSLESKGDDATEVREFISELCGLA